MTSVGHFADQSLRELALPLLPRMLANKLRTRNSIATERQFR